jgi:hypothetical protein
MDPTKPILGYFHPIQISTPITTIKAYKEPVRQYAHPPQPANTHESLLRKKFPIPNSKQIHNYLVEVPGVVPGLQRKSLKS